jgi:TM2 domain-containing membrane protein YozV
MDVTMHRGKHVIVAFLLWALLGFCGAHRFYVGKYRSAFYMMIICLFQWEVVFSIYIDPFSGVSLYRFWLPVSAFDSLQGFWGAIFPTSQFGLDQEELMVQPILAFSTIPALLLTVWAVLDGLKIVRWVRADESIA